MSYPFFINGMETGALEEKRENLKVVLTAKCPGRSDGLYRAFAVTQNGRLPMGVMMPENGSLVARRSFSPQETAGLRGGEGILQYRFGEKPDSPDAGNRAAQETWKILPSPGARFSDPLLRRLWAAVPGALMKKGEGGMLIAAPLTEGREQPLAAIFCLGNPTEIDGREYLVFSFASLGE